METIRRDEVCDHCKKEIKEVTSRHGFAFDWFYCPHCKKENVRR